jgi:CxxC motif-containing protein (DUF1111 family)
MTTLSMPQGAAGRLATVAVAAAVLTLGSYYAVLGAGSASVRDAEFNSPAAAKALRAAALESDCMNKAVTQRVKNRTVPSPRELNELRASCGHPVRS